MALLRHPLTACALLFLSAGNVSAQISFEYELKAAFLYRFTEFVQWPGAAFQAPDSPIRICVFGSDPFGDALERTLAGERVDNRALAAVRPPTVEALSECHVVFISQSEQRRIPSILMELRDMPILTIADMPGFLESGGVINFVEEGGRLRFDVNVDVAERAGLQMSSRLLRLARVVQPAGRTG